jgi:hypothetical protein
MKSSNDVEIPWRKGSWLDAQEAMQSALDLGATIEELGDMLRGSVGAPPDDWRTFNRLNELHRLGYVTAFYRRPRISQHPTELALRAEARGMIAYSTSMGLPALKLALDDPAMSDSSLVAAQLALAEQLVVEQIELIYDFDAMRRAALHYALFFLHRAESTGRYGDFRCAVGAAELVINSGHHEHATIAAVAQLECAMRTGVVAQKEVRRHLLMIAQLYGIVAPLIEQGTITPLSPDLVQAAGTLTEDDIHAENTDPHREATVNRLLTAYHASHNPSYLNDLLMFTMSREAASHEEEMEDLADGAVAMHLRGLSRNDVGDLRGAVDLSTEALSRKANNEEPTDHHVARVNNHFTYILAVLRAVGEGAAHAHETYDRMLDETARLASDPSPFGAIQLLRCDYALTAAAQSAAAVDRVRFLGAARARIDGLLEYVADDADDNWLLALRRAITSTARAVRDQTAAANEAQDHLATFITATLDQPGRGLVALSLAEVSVQAGVAGDALLEALRRAYGAQELGMTAHMTRDTRLGELATVAVLKARDLEANRIDPQSLGTQLREVFRNAATSGSEDPERVQSDAPLIRAGLLACEAAVQLAEVSETEMAAMFAQVAVGVRATGALGERRLERDHPVASVSDSACAIVIAGWNNALVLTKGKGEGWATAVRIDNAVIDAIEIPVIDQGCVTPSDIIAMKQALTQAQEVLKDVLGDFVARETVAGDVVMCVLTGKFTQLPLQLLTPSMSAELPNLVYVAGWLSDAIPPALQQRSSDTPVCLFLAGAKAIDGSRTVDTHADLHAIQAAKLPVAVYGERHASHATGTWPPTQRADVVHYAGHLAPLGPDDTALMLADGSSLTLAAIREAKLVDIKLVVLMCCYASAASSPGAGTQIHHLAGAFLEAGAQAVIAPLWPAFDHPALLFTRALYESLGRRCDVSTAFREGVNKVRHFRMGDATPYAHPLFWAGITLIAGAGAWLPPPNDEDRWATLTGMYPNFAAAAKRVRGEP